MIMRMLSGRMTNLSVKLANIRFPLQVPNLQRRTCKGESDDDIFIVTDLQVRNLQRKDWIFGFFTCKMVNV
jgi:hypothetical protein